jgi:hypothetical protein
MPPPWVLPAAALLWAGVTTVIAWAFASGKFAGNAVTKEQLQAALEEKADCDRVAVLSRRVQGEHEERKRLLEAINAQIGTIRVDQGRQYERIKGVEQDVTELRRKVFNGGGMAGV